LFNKIMTRFYRNSIASIHHTDPIKNPYKTTFFC